MKLKGRRRPTARPRAGHRPRGGAIDARPGRQRQVARRPPPDPELRRRKAGCHLATGPDRGDRRIQRRIRQLFTHWPPILAMSAEGTKTLDGKGTADIVVPLAGIDPLTVYRVQGQRQRRLGPDRGERTAGGRFCRRAAGHGADQARRLDGRGRLEAGARAEHQRGPAVFRLRPAEDAMERQVGPFRHGAIPVGRQVPVPGREGGGRRFCQQQAGRRHLGRRRPAVHHRPGPRVVGEAGQVRYFRGAYQERPRWRTATCRPIPAPPRAWPRTSSYRASGPVRTAAT